MKLGQRTHVKASRPPILGWLGLLLALILGLLTTPFGGFRTVAQPVKSPIRQIFNLPGGPIGSQIKADLPVLTVDMDFANYNTILAQRERALSAGGVNIASSDDFVNATIHLSETTTRARLRLQQGIIQQLGADDKWPFEIRVDDDAPPVLGFRRFYLQDPNGENEAEALLTRKALAWTLQRESILTTQYRAVRLIFNGDDRGVYMVQQGFDEVLLTNQGRASGVVVAFNADRLWESVVHFQGNPQAAFADPVTNLTSDDFRYFEIDTYRDADLAADQELSAQREAAISLLYTLQAGERSASKVFNVEQYGRFLALLDLWGATEATSLVNLSYYYDAPTSTLEPISFNADPFGPGDRISLAATYDNPQIQAAYVDEATRVSESSYLEILRAELSPVIEQWQRELGASNASIDRLWDHLRERQGLMQQSLNPVRPVFAYLETPSSPPYDILSLRVGNALNLPVEILGFDISGATFLEADRGWITQDSLKAILKPDRSPGSSLTPILLPHTGTRTPMVRYAQFNVPLTTIHAVDEESDFTQPLDLRIAVRILGAEQVHLVPAQTGLAEPVDAPPVGNGVENATEE